MIVVTNERGFVEKEATALSTLFINQHRVLLLRVC